MDIYIGGVPERNTALNGDDVAALFHPQEQWKVFYSSLEAYLEEHSDLKALVYMPFEPRISRSDNACSSSLPNATHNTNTTSHISSNSGYHSSENENVDGNIASSPPLEPAGGKKKKHRRGKKGRKKIAEVLKDSFKYAKPDDTYQQVVKDPPHSSCEIGANEASGNNEPKKVASHLAARNNVVLPHELSECELSDGESVSSECELSRNECASGMDTRVAETFVIAKTKSGKRTKGKKLQLQKSVEDYPAAVPHSVDWANEAHFVAKQSRSVNTLDLPNKVFKNKNKELESNNLDPQDSESSSQKSLQRTVPTVAQVMRLDNWGMFIQRTAFVVRIMERRHPMVAAGILKLFNDRNPHMALFSPFDSRIPRIRIQMQNCPPDFFVRHTDYAKKILLAKILEWNDPKFAFGVLLKDVGDMGDIEAETEALLHENYVDFSEFSDEALQQLPKLPWTISEQEITSRLDLRKCMIFTIDPATARDMDDAVSCLPQPSGNFRVGVHIADVTHFIPADSPLDRVAAARSTSVYLVQKVIPMLPRVLCENLCSLNPGVDRLAFSVIWELDRNGGILGEWFGRTVIRSCAKLSYDHAQSMMENEDGKWNEEEFPPITGGYSVANVATAVINLHKIAVILREKRKRNGALQLNQVKLCFSLDEETKDPNGVFVFEQKDSHRLIEELMLLANIAVAHKISNAFPKQALLRRHPPPHDVQMATSIKFLSQRGICLDATSSKTLDESLRKYAGSDPVSVARMQFIVNVCSKPMQFARYFCAGLAPSRGFYHHYALNVPCYTHFTSPIRRYPDIMAHRLLAAALDKEKFPLPRWSLTEIEKRAEYCNWKKQASKAVQEANAELFLALFIRKLGEIVTEGIIVGVLDKAVDVLVIELGVIKRCYLEKLPLNTFHFVEAKNENFLLIEWKEDERVNLPSFTQRLTYFEFVTVSLRPFENGALKVNAFLERPDLKT